MNILYFFYPVIILLGGLFLRLGDTDKNRRIYIIIMLLLLTAESCLRGVSIGSDTENYYYWWELIKSTKWSEIFTDFSSRYILNDGTDDVGFNVYTKVLQLLSGNFQYFLLVSALCFFIPLGMLLYRYIDKMYQLMFIFIFYVSLFNPIAMSGVRKEIALGISILAFLYYVDKKYVKMFLAVAIGTTIHMSTLLFMLVPILGFLRPRFLKALHVVTFFLIPIVIAASSAIIVFMGESVGNEKYIEYGLHGSQGGAMTFVILIEMLSLFCLVAFWRVNLSNDKMLSKLYIMLPCFTFFAPLITNNGSMIRISQYYHVYLLVLLPMAVGYFSRGKNKGSYYVLMAVVLIVLALATRSGEYYFFWQDEYSYLFLN